MPIHGEERGFNDQRRDDPRWGLIERIASSQQLKSSPRLQEFLFYVSECAIRDAPGDATEQQIGIHVFGRSPGYNSSEDSIVRTHARLLRQKLTGYFAMEGSGEQMIVDMPKGHYLPIFTARVQPDEIPTLPVLLSDSTPATPRSRSRPPNWQIAGGLLLFLMVITALLWQPWKLHVTKSPIEVFWHPFFTDAPFVIYSNALFTGNSATGLRYASPGASVDENTKESFVDTYTGIGELAAVYDLTTLFDSHQATFILKRSQLVAWDEAKSRNLIFIGASVENPSLRVLPPTIDFTAEAQSGYAGIINHHPKPGEPAVYSRPERPLTTDYAIIALLPGVQPGKRVLLFTGLTTFGTQAAVEYLCHPENVAVVLKNVSGPNGEIRPFEAVIQTNIGGGVTLQTHLVTIRVH